MKKALRGGTYMDVNVYFADIIGEDLLGWCGGSISSTPSFGPAPMTPSKPICISSRYDHNHGRLRGVHGIDAHGIKPNDLGRVLTHELGHWHSLDHTFDGGCTATNDRIDGTPAQHKPTWGCPEKNSDTCTVTARPGRGVIASKGYR